MHVVTCIQFLRDFVRDHYCNHITVTLNNRVEETKFSCNNFPSFCVKLIKGQKIWNFFATNFSKFPKKFPICGKFT